MDVYQAAIERVRLDKKLKHIEKLLFLFLVDLAEQQGGSIHMSLRALEKSTDVSIAALSLAIPRLSQLGFIRASLLPGKTGHASYLIYVDPTIAAEKPPAEVMEVRVN